LNYGLDLRTFALRRRNPRGPTASEVVEQHHPGLFIIGAPESQDHMGSNSRMPHMNSQQDECSPIVRRVWSPGKPRCLPFIVRANAEQPVDIDETFRQAWTVNKRIQELNERLLVIFENIELERRPQWRAETPLLEMETL
jgi:hypothetical protein